MDLIKLKNFCTMRETVSLCHTSTCVNRPQAYVCPPPTTSPCPSRLSQSTGFGLPLSCIICFISYYLSISNIHNAYFLHSNYNLQMFNNSHLINHQLFFLESFVMPGRYLISFDFLLPTTFGQLLQIPQIIVFLSSYIFFHSCKHTSASDNI